MRNEALLVTGVTPEDTNHLREILAGHEDVSETESGTAFILSNIEKNDDLSDELENGFQKVGIKATITGFFQHPSKSNAPGNDL